MRRRKHAEAVLNLERDRYEDNTAFGLNFDEDVDVDGDASMPQLDVDPVRFDFAEGPDGSEFLEVAQGFSVVSSPCV